MTLAPFEYVRPTSLDSALEALQAPGSVPLAGGHHLLTWLKRRERTVSTLVDLSRVAELRGVTLQPDGDLRIGAMTTLADLLATGGPGTGDGAVRDALSGLGDRQSRHRVTVGGQLASGTAANDLAAALIGLDATVRIATAGGHERRDPLVDCWDRAGRPTLAPGELITAVTLTVDGGGSGSRGGSGYCRVVDAATRDALCGVAAAVVHGDGGQIARATVVVVGAVASPLRLTALEEWLVRGGDALRAPCLPEQVSLLDDLRASADYRRQLTGLLARRAVALARERAR